MFIKVSNVFKCFKWKIETSAAGAGILPGIRRSVIVSVATSAEYFVGN
jgi:hypothetical protein